MSSPFTAKVGIPSSTTSEAATSSWVDSGFEAQMSTSAPPALSVRRRLAVSVVTCRQAAATDAGQWALLGETLPDGGEHRHVGVGPRDALLPEVGQPEIGDVVVNGGRGHGLLLVMAVALV